MCGLRSVPSGHCFQDATVRPAVSVFHLDLGFPDKIVLPAPIGRGHRAYIPRGVCHHGDSEVSPLTYIDQEIAIDTKVGFGADMPLARLVKTICGSPRLLYCATCR
jgi:hypothetical protein